MHSLGAYERPVSSIFDIQYRSYNHDPTEDDMLFEYPVLNSSVYTAGAMRTPWSQVLINKTGFVNGLFVDTIEGGIDSAITQLEFQ